MARQTGWLRFTGKLNNHIGYCRNGTYFLRSMPTTVRQTNATKQAARRFGVASRKARIIRQACIPSLNIRQDCHLVNRLNKHCLQAATNIDAIQGFRFNKNHGLDKYCTALPQLLPHQQLFIPPQSFQTNADTLEVKLIAVRINFNTLRITASRTFSVRIDTRCPFHGLLLDASLPGHDPLLLIVQVQPLTLKSGNKRIAEVTADIIAVIPSPKKTATPTHIPHINKVFPTPQQSVLLPTDAPDSPVPIPRE